MVKSTPLKPRQIDDPKRIRVLSSPVRHEIVDTLSALGGCVTVARLAEHLGRHADGLYYHLKLLSKAALIEEVTAKDGERAFRLAGGGAAPLRLAYRTGRKANVSALATYARGLLKVAQRDFLRAVADPHVAAQGKRRQLWAARNKGWLSEGDLEELNELLERLCTLTSQHREPGRDVLMSLAFSLAPLEPRGKRRGAAA
jgi:DNA-binding transcriptional ArsR family regulator